MKTLAVIFALSTLPLAACAEGPSDQQIASRSCAWATDSSSWHLCMERANDRMEAQHAREDAAAGAFMMNSFASPRSCMNIGGVVTCQ